MYCNNHITDTKVAHPINMKRDVLTIFTPSKNDMACMENTFLSSKHRRTFKLLKKEERERDLKVNLNV